jgi:hypothetical protein
MADIGRPTKYDPRYCQEIIDFFTRNPYEPMLIDNIGDDGEISKVPALTKHGTPILIPCQLPTFEGFAIKIGVHRETLLNWVESNPDFFDAYKRAKDMQKEILIQNGLVGAYDKTFAIFTAKNVTDMRDKQDSEITQTTTHIIGESLAEKLTGGSKR